jgi:hypothetical protein
MHLFTMFSQIFLLNNFLPRLEMSFTVKWYSLSKLNEIHYYCGEIQLK